MNVKEILSASNAKEMYGALSKEIELPLFEELLSAPMHKDLKLDRFSVLYFGESNPKKGFMRICLKHTDKYSIDVEWDNGEISTVKIVKPPIKILRAVIHLQIRYHIDSEYYDYWPLETAVVTS